MRKHITYIIVPSLKINSKSISVSSFVNKNLAEREREIDCSLDPSSFLFELEPLPSLISA